MSATTRTFRGRLGIARAGYAQIALATGIALGGALVLAPWLGAAAAGTALLPAFVTWFFRDPERRTIADATSLLAPADGTIDDVREEADCGFFPGPALRIGIYLSLWSVHVQRAPCAARGVRTTFRPGRRIATHRVGATDDNEQCVTVFARAGDDMPLTVRQLAGPIARGIVNVVTPDRHFVAGERFGLIRFGSRVEVFVPADRVRLRVAPGERVRAGITVLGQVTGCANEDRAATSSATTPPRLERRP